MSLSANELVPHPRSHFMRCSCAPSSRGEVLLGTVPVAGFTMSFLRPPSVLEVASRIFFWYRGDVVPKRSAPFTVYSLLEHADFVVLMYNEALLGWTFAPSSHLSVDGISAFRWTPNVGFCIPRQLQL